MSSDCEIVSAKLSDTQLFLKQRTYDMDVDLALGGIYIIDELQREFGTVYHLETKAVKQSNKSCEDFWKNNKFCFNLSFLV